MNENVRSTQNLIHELQVNIHTALSLPKPIDLQDESDWRDDTLELQRLSLLKEADQVTHPPISESLLTVIFRERHSKGIIPTKEMLDYFKHMDAKDFEAFEEGILFEDIFKEIVHIGKKDPQNGRLELVALAHTLSHRVSSLAVGECLTFYYSIPSRHTFSQNILIQKILKSLLPPSMADHLITAESASVKEFTKKQVEQCTQPLKEQLLKSVSPVAEKCIKDILENGLHSFLPVQLQGGIIDRSLKRISDSFKDCLKRRLIRQFPKENRADIEAIAKSIVEKGIAKTIEEKLENATDLVSNMADSTVSDMEQTLLRELPSGAATLLKPMGLKSAENALWFEIERSTPSSYTVKIHGFGEALDNHPTHTINSTPYKQITLAYDSVEETQFEHSFFFQLLSMRAWPEWNSDIEFSLQDLYKDLFEHFGKPQKNPSLSIPQGDSELIKGPFELLEKLFLRQQSIPAEEVLLLFDYPRLKKQVLSLWNIYSTKGREEKWCPLLLKASSALSRLSMELHQKKQIDETELKKIYATVWEIEKNILNETKGVRGQTASIQWFSAETKKQMDQLISYLGDETHRLQALQEALISVFGDEMKEDIEILLKNYPLPVKKQKNEEEKEEISPLSRFKKEISQFRDEIKEELHEANFFDFVFLIIKILKRARNWLLYGSGFSITLKAFCLIDETLAARWAPYRTCSFIRSVLVSKILSAVAPFVVKKVLPKWVFLALNRASSTCKNIARYCEKNAIKAGVKWALPRYLPQEKKEEMRLFIKKWRHKITRDGEISFKTRKKEVPVTSLSLETTKTVIAPQSSEYIKPQAISLPTMPYQVVLTPKNALSEILLWKADSLRFSPHPNLQDLYLIDQIKNLPVPTKAADCLWKQIDDPATIMHALLELVPCESQYQFYAEKWISTLTIYAIIDALAKRLTHYEDGETTPPELYIILYSSTFVVSDTVLSNRLLSIYSYFNIDTKHKPSLEKLKQVNQNFLLRFHFDDFREWVYIEVPHCIPSTCVKKDKVLSLVTPLFQRIMALFPELEERFLAFSKEDQPLSESDKISLLFQNPLLSSAPNKDQAAFCVRHMSPQDAHARILPHSYALLGKAYRLLIGLMQSDSQLQLTKRTHEQELLSSTLCVYPKKLGNLFNFLAIDTNETYFNLYRNPSIITTNLTKFAQKYISRSENGVQNSTPEQERENAILNHPTLSIEAEKAVSYTHSSESILRLLSYYHTYPTILLNPSANELEPLPHIEDITNSLLKFDVLRVLLKQTPSAVKHIANFFHFGLNEFIKWGEGGEVALQMITQINHTHPDIIVTNHYIDACIQFILCGISTASLCEHLIENSSELFPNFREELLGRLWNIIAKTLQQPQKLTLIAKTLLQIYSNKSLINTDGTVNERMLHDIILYGYISTPSKGFLDFKYEYIYRCHLADCEALLEGEENRSRKNKLLNEVYSRSNLIEVKPYHWEGTFPHYVSGSLIFSFTSSSKNSPQNSRINEIINAAERTLKYSIEKLTEVEENRFVIDDIGVTVLLNDDELSFYCTVGDKNFRLLSKTDMTTSLPLNTSFPKDELIWLQIASPCVYPLELYIGHPWNENSQKFTVLDAEDMENKIWHLQVEWRSPEETVEEVDLKEVPHELHLLSWLSSFQQIKAFCSPQKGDHFHHITLDELNLTLEIKRESNGELRAYTKDVLPGFFVAKKQGHPSLKSHSKYLLLRNEQNDIKVLIPKSHPAQFLASHLFDTHAKDLSHPLIKHLFEKNLGLLDDNKNTPYYLLTLNKKGLLTSEESPAVAFLLLYYLANGTEEEIKQTAEELKRLSLLERFSEETLDMLLPFYFLPLIDKRQKTELFSLKIISFLEENKLIPSTNQFPHLLDEKALVKLSLIWAGKIGIFLHYLNKTAAFEEERLSEYQEWIILYSISQDASTLLTRGCYSLVGDARKVVDLIGLSTVAENLMMPSTMAQRFRGLRKKYALKGEITTGKLELAFRLCSLNTPQSDSQESSEDQKKHNESSTLNPIVKEIAQLALNPSWNRIETTTVIDSLHISSWIPLLSVDDALTGALCVPLEVTSYTPGDISTYFLSYYILATKTATHFFQEPQEWASEHERQRKHEKFQQASDNQKKLLPFLQSLKFSTGKREFILKECLKEIILKGNPNFFPSLKELKLTIRNYSNDPKPFKAHLKSIIDYAKKGKTLKEWFHSPIFRALSKFTVSHVASLAKQKVVNTAKEAALGALGGPLYGAWQAIKFGKQGLALAQNIKQVYQEELQTESRSATLEISSKEICLSTLFSTFLHSIDTHFDVLLEQIIKAHLLEQESEMAPKTHLLKPHNEAPLLTQRQCDQFNKSCLDFDEREKKQRLYRGRQTENALSPVIESLSTIYQHLQAQLTCERDQILAFVNHNRLRKRKSPPSIREALLMGPKIGPEENATLTPLDFTAVSHLFLSDNIQEWIRLTYLTESEIAILQEQLYIHFVNYTRKDQIERLIELAKTANQTTGDDFEAVFEDLVSEFQKKRGYSMRDLPSRLVRTHLIFEAMNGKLLWESQARQEDQLLLMEGNQKVVELIMGSGKTFFGIPTSDFYCADGKTLVINIWPGPAAAVSTRQTARQALASFGQNAHALHFERSTKLNKGTLIALLRRFENCISEKAHINMSKEGAQALELKMILLAAEISSENSPISYLEKEEKKEELFYMMRLLHIVRKKGKINIDEVHEVLSRKKELNYPFGRSSQMDPQWIHTIGEVIRILSQTKEFDKILSLREDQKPLDEVNYHKYILPHLSQRIAVWPFLEIPHSQRDEISHYMCGHLKYIPQSVIESPKRAHIDLIKGIVTLILPKALALKPKENFGPSKVHKNAEFARPYEACEKPNEQATIRSPFEASVKTFLLFLYSGLDITQTENLIKSLQRKASKESNKKRIPPYQTKAGRLLSSWFNNVSLEHIDRISTKKRHDTLKNNKEAILIYAKEVCSRIRYYKKNIKSQSSNLASMSHSFLADSGSLFNHETYPEGTRVIWDKGTQGETKHLLQIKQTIGSVELLSGTTASLILKEITDRYCTESSKKCALIDRGALLRGISNEQAARIILDSLKEHKSSLMGVIFYNDKNEIMILERGATSAILLHQSTLPKEKRFTYFDQAHTYASDIPQPYFGEAVVTVSENTTLENFAQAVWRMRGLRKKQSITAVMTQELSKKISLKEKPSLEEIYAYMIHREAQEIGEDNYFADRQKIHDMTRRAILDKMYASLEDLDTEKCNKDEAIKKSLSLFTEFQDQLIEEDSDDPTDLFGSIDATEDPRDLLLYTLRLKWAKLEKSASFSPVELERLQDIKEHWEKKLSQSDISRYPDKVHTYLKDGAPHFAAQEGLFQEQIAEEEGADQIEDDQEMDMETETSKATDQEMDAQSSVQSKMDDPISASWLRPTPWREDLNCFDLSWIKFEELAAPAKSLLEKTKELSVLTKKTASTLLAPLSSKLKFPLSSKVQKTLNEAGVPLYRFQDFIARSHEDALSEVAKRFDTPIFCTHNFAPVVAQGVLEYPIDPLDKRRKFASEILVIDSSQGQGNPHFHIGLIDHSDVAFWKSRLQNNLATPLMPKIAIYNIGLRSVIYSSHGEIDSTNLHQNPLFIRSLVQVKFFEGHVHFNKQEYDALKEWLFEEAPHLMKEAYLKILHSRNRSYQNSCIEEILEEAELF